MGDTLGALFSTSGRASRREFWKWQAISTLVPVAVFGVEALIRYRRDGAILPESVKSGVQSPAAEPVIHHEDNTPASSDVSAVNDVSAGADPWADIVADGAASQSDGSKIASEPASDTASSGSDAASWDDIVPPAGFAPENADTTSSDTSGEDSGALDSDLQMMRAFPMTTAVSVLVAVPAGVVAIRRLHDMDKSGWHLLWSLVPVVGWPAFAMLSSQPGTDGPNRFGPPLAD